MRQRLDELKSTDPEYGEVRALYTSMTIDAERRGFFHSGSGSDGDGGSADHSSGVGDGGGPHDGDSQGCTRHPRLQRRLSAPEAEEGGLEKIGELSRTPQTEQWEIWMDWSEAVRKAAVLAEKQGHITFDQPQ